MPSVRIFRSKPCGPCPPIRKSVFHRRVTVALLSVSFVLAGMMPGTHAVAAQKCAFILTDAQFKARGVRLRGLLKEKRYAALEDELQARQLEVRREKASDELLRLDYQSAFDRDPAIEPLLSEWVSAYPRSYLARVARGYHYVEAGFAKRGTDFASTTSKEQFDAMAEQFERAVVDLKAAESLDEMPTLVYAKLILLARTSRGYGNVAEIVELTNKRFQKSLSIKVSATFALNPKWGGSFEELDGLIASAQAAGMGAEDIATIRYRVEIEKGDYYNEITKQKARAATHYRAAGEVCETDLPWEKAIRASYAGDDWDNLIVAADRLIKLDPGSVATFRRRGWAFESTKRMQLAVKDYEVAARMGDPWAQNKFGWILWQGADMPKDLERARKLFEQSAAQGNTNAQDNLKRLSAVLEKK